MVGGGGGGEEMGVGGLTFGGKRIEIFLGGRESPVGRFFQVGEE